MASPLTSVKTAVDTVVACHDEGIVPILCKKRIKALTTALLLGMGTTAQADCAALQPLAVMHDAYLALHTETDQITGATAANQLLKYVPIYSAKTFKNTFSSMNMDVEIARLEKVLIDAFFLGRDVLAGRQGNISEIHKQNARWLTRLVARTGCFTPKRTGPVGSDAARLNSSSATRNALDPLGSAPQAQALGTVALVALLTILAGVAGYAIYHSRPLRIRRVERLPRHLVAFKAYATVKGSNYPIIVLDISLGGAKIECDHPPTERERITLGLPCGEIPATIVWATAFYAGVMFDTQLSEESLQTILNDDGVTTRSKLSNVF